MAGKAAADYSLLSALKSTTKDNERLAKEADSTLVQASSRALNVLKHIAESTAAPIGCEGETPEDRARLGAALQRGLRALQTLEAARLEAADASSAAAAAVNEGVLPPAGTNFAAALAKGKGKRDYSALALKSDRWKTYKDVATVEAAVKRALKGSGAAGAGAADDDVEIGVAPSQDPAAALKCPLTLKLMQKPMRSKVCNHAYDEAGVLPLLNKKPVAVCPYKGCGKPLKRSDLFVDEQLAMEVEDFLRRKKQEQEEEEEDSLAAGAGAGGSSSVKRPRRAGAVDDDEDG